MSDTFVRLEHLPPMRVARFRAESASPEQDAWRELREWAGPRGLLDDPVRHPIFGFNNPAPVAGRRDYGYELWLVLDPARELEHDAATLAFPGGWYAVTRIDGLPHPGVWFRLWEWLRHSPVRHRPDHELERPLNPLAPEAEWQFDLYLPIEARTDSPDTRDDATPATAVRAFIDAINSHDVDAIAACMTEDHTFVDSGGTTVSGRTVMADGWRQYLAMFPDYVIEVESIMHDPGCVAAFGSWRATYAGPGGPSNENAVGGPAAWRAVVADGRIRRWQVYADHTHTVEVMKRDAERAAVAGP